MGIKIELFWKRDRKRFTWIDEIWTGIEKKGVKIICVELYWQRDGKGLTWIDNHSLKLKNSNRFILKNRWKKINMDRRNIECSRDERIEKDIDLLWNIDRKRLTRE